jgi:hypothetical protein
LEVFYDSFPEGMWFRNLDSRLEGVDMYPFPPPAAQPGWLQPVLSLDRPDIVLVDNEQPILVLERTIEVPSGHNVGQRFARLVAAARSRVPAVYFGPYAAFKHGGITSGPRYMNLRLFYAIEQMIQIEQTAITTIRWPVDSDYEIIQTPDKDVQVRAYMTLFFDLYDELGVPGLIPQLMSSQFELALEQERQDFIDREVVNSAQYDGPPDSVVIGGTSSLVPVGTGSLPLTETVLYQVGMNYIRSDPYTGMAMLYSYLYCGGIDQRTRNLVLSFPGISVDTWQEAVARTPNAKHIRLYRYIADGILFSDGYLPRDAL